MADKERAEADAALARACASGDAQGVRAALALGADPDSPTAWSLAGGWVIQGERPRPLHMAFRRGEGEVARALLEGGADPLLPSMDGRSAASWLTMGLSECASQWIAAGGDPWRIEKECAAGKGCLAMVAARGGSAELWALIAARPASGWVIKGQAPDDQFGLGGLARVCIQWTNEAALRALGQMGWEPSGADVIACFHHWAAGARWESRGMRLALALRELGAPMPNKADARAMISCFGPESIERLFGELEARFAKCDARQLAKAARRARPSANAARRAPRL